MTVNKVDLKLLDFYVREVIDEEEIALYKESKHLSEPQDEYIISWPKNWWEHFKDRWFPKWAKKKWPIRKEAHKIKISILYPKFKISLPDEETTCRVSIYKCWDDASLST